MKATYPHPAHIQQELLKMHKRAKSFPSTGFRKKVFDIHERIMAYEEVRLYNKYARKTCGFRISDTCTKRFDNNLRHYAIYGNCCRNCNHSFLENLKNKDKTITHEL